MRACASRRMKRASPVGLMSVRFAAARFVVERFGMAFLAAGRFALARFSCSSVLPSQSLLERRPAQLSLTSGGERAQLKAGLA